MSTPTSRFKPRTTLRDIADRVGVSINTVSFVVNGSRSGTRVSGQTRERIWKVAQELGYRPNAVARQLRSSQTHTIGFFSDFDFLAAENLFLSEIIGGIQEACSEFGMDVLLHSVRGVEDDAVVDHLSSGRTDGVILYAPYRPNLGARFMAAGVPTVGVVDRCRDIPCVLADEGAGGRLQAEFLSRRGVKRALYRGFKNLPPSSRDRYVAFRTRAAELGIEVVLGVPFSRFDEWRFAAEDRERIERGFRTIVCWEDNSAHGTAWELERLGYRVPEDVMVVGYNGLGTHQPVRYTIPTVVAPWRGVARAALRTVNDLIAGRDVAEEVALSVRFSEEGALALPLSNEGKTL